MKRMLVIGSIAALAFVGMAGTANAAPNDNACFGQIHKTINTDPEGLLGYTSVAAVVSDFGGQGKKAVAGACRG